MSKGRERTVSKRSRPGYLTIVTNVLSGAGAQVVTAVAALWSIPQLLQVIGPSGYGTYSIATALVGYLSIADLGLNNATLQRLAKARGANDVEAFGKTAGTSALLLGGIGLLVATALFALAPFVGAHLAGSSATLAQQRDVAAVARWCGVGSLAVFLRPVLEAVISASERLTSSYAASVVANLLRTVGAVFAVWVWPHALTPVIVLVVASVAQLLLLLPLAAASIPELRWRHVRASRAELRDLLHVSIPLWLSQAVGILANQVDRFVVSGWFGLAAVGRYAVAQDLANRFWMAPYIFGKAYFPRLARNLAVDEPAAHERLIRGYAVAVLLSCTIPGVPFATFGREVLAGWTGSANLDDAPAIFAWLVAGVAANCACLAGFSVLQIKVRSRVIAGASALSFATHVAGCVVLPRFFGPTGAAASWALSQISFAAVVHVYARAYRLRLLWDLVRCVAASVPVLIGSALYAGAHPVTVDLRASTAARLLLPLERVGFWCAVGLASAALLFADRVLQSASLLSAKRRQRAESVDSTPS